MKWLNRLSLTLIGLLGIGAVRNFFQKYEILIFDKNDVNEAREEELTQESAMDLRGRPTHVCVCGCNQFMVRAVFEDYEIATYFLDMVCANCGSLATAPTPVDREEMDQ
jgi:hypothetical protein